MIVLISTNLSPDTLLLGEKVAVSRMRGPEKVKKIPLTLALSLRERGQSGTCRKLVIISLIVVLLNLEDCFQSTENTDYTDNH